MVRLFEGQGITVRAQQVWMVLVEAAANRRTITYLELALRMGFNENSRHLTARYLEPVARYCQQEGLPVLTSLVVSEVSGLPGTGLLPFIPEGSSYESERELVYRDDWYRLIPPSPDDFQDAMG